MRSMRVKEGKNSETIVSSDNENKIFGSQVNTLFLIQNDESFWGRNAYICFLRIQSSSKLTLADRLTSGA